ncbi:MAG: polysaccharide biosynthesis tyrosine autokinase, partial [Acidobacteria bacterium]|nr:polysaccharide biosynthesis tyrosine autokinase [Acidobacteriota bacterium]
AEAFERFKAKQAAHKNSPRVLAAAASNPNIVNFVPKWANLFTSNGVYVPDEGAMWLDDHIKTATDARTSFVILSITWKDKVEVTELVKYLKLAYLDSLEKQASGSSAEERVTLESRMTSLETSIKDLQDERDELVVGVEADSLDPRVMGKRADLDRISQVLLEVRTGLTTYQTRLQSWEAELNNPVGVVVYPEEIRAMVEDDPIVLGIKQQIATLESLRIAELSRFTANHRNILRIVASIEGQKTTLEETKQRLFRQRFDAIVDQHNSMIANLSVQELQFQDQVDALRIELMELTQMQALVVDLTHRIENKQTAMDEADNRVAEIVAQRLTRHGTRVTVFEPERVPKQVTLPKIYLVVPAISILCLGLVGGLVTLIEVMDQRVKGPSDLASLPHTRVLSTIPHAREDPSSPSVIETAFRDEPRGVLAESIRQTRSAIFERMKAGSYKTLLVASATPGAGATTIVSNLGVAAAHADRRVLVVDANFRRPSLHKVFGLEQGPGLSDVLAGTTSLESAVQATDTAKLAILTCGSEENRLFEHLASDRMGEALKQAAAAYDLVLIDVSPSIVSGDALSLADQCDATMLVVRAFDAKRGLVARLRGELGEQHAEFLGVVINAVCSAAGGYFRRNIQQTHRYQNSA